MSFPFDIPADVIDAAMKVRNFFEQQGVRDWEFAGLRPVRPEESELSASKVDRGFCQATLTEDVSRLLLNFTEASRVKFADRDKYTLLEVEAYKVAYLTEAIVVLAAKHHLGNCQVAGWPTVEEFAKAMASKLEANRHKGNRAGWLTCSEPELLQRLMQETCELMAELIRGDFSAARSEAADVGNFAMMIYDRAGQRVRPDILEAMG